MDKKEEQKPVIPTDLASYTHPKPLTKIMVSCGVFFAIGVCALVGAIYFYDSPLMRTVVKLLLIPLFAVGSIPVLLGTFGLWFGERELVRIIETNLGLSVAPDEYYDENAPDPQQEEGWVDPTPPAQNTRSRTHVEGAKRRRGRPRKQKGGDESDK